MDSTLPDDGRHSPFLPRTPKITLLEHHASEGHFSIFNPKRPLRNLYDFYTCLMNLFADTALSVVLHDRTYVSIASIMTYPDLPLETLHLCSHFCYICYRKLSFVYLLIAFILSAALTPPSQFQTQLQA